MAQWWERHETLVDQIWARLAGATTDRHAPLRTPMLASLGADGAPELRTVVLRAADRDGATVTLFTDLRSAKMEGIARDPRASLTGWDDGAALQVRLRGTLHVAPDAERAALWSRLPQHAHADYGADPAPGTPIPAPGPRTAGNDPAAFGVLRLAISRIEALHLGRTVHHRALYSPEDGWAGTWLAP